MGSLVSNCVTFLSFNILVFFFFGDSLNMAMRALLFFLGFVALFVLLFMPAGGVPADGAAAAGTERGGKDDKEMAEKRRLFQAQQAPRSWAECLLRALEAFEIGISKPKTFLRIPPAMIASSSCGGSEAVGGEYEWAELKKRVLAMAGLHVSAKPVITVSVQSSMLADASEFEALIKKLSCFAHVFVLANISPSSSNSNFGAAAATARAKSAVAEGGGAAVTNVVTAAALAAEEEEEAKVWERLAGVRVSVIPDSRIILHSTSVGKVATVRQLKPHIHIDYDMQVCSTLQAHIGVVVCVGGSSSSSSSSSSKGGLLHLQRLSDL